MCAGWYKRGAQNTPLNPYTCGKPLITNYEFSCVLGIITGDQNRKATSYVYPRLQQKKNEKRDAVMGVIECREECC
jgi:hypothetical protein